MSARSWAAGHPFDAGMTVPVLDRCLETVSQAHRYLRRSFWDAQVEKTPAPHSGRWLSGQLGKGRRRSLGWLGLLSSPHMSKPGPTIKFSPREPAGWGTFAPSATEVNGMCWVYTSQLFARGAEGVSRGSRSV
jgi:hypothetical protein